MQAIKLNLASNLQEGHHLIVHGVNTLGFMGAGVAKALAREHPKLRGHYRKYISDRLSGQDCFASFDKPPAKRHSDLLGEIFYFDVNNGRKSGPVIANLFCQAQLRKYKGEVVASRNAILKGMANIIRSEAVNNSHAFMFDDPNYDKKVSSIPATNIYFPRIGCDLGGLDWNELGPKIFELFKDQTHVRPVLVEWP